MVKVNADYHSIARPFIFPMIEAKVAKHPKPVINLGIGDISLPLIPTVAKAIKEAVHKMEKTPVGYGPSTGYPFLKEAIIENEYHQYGISTDEVFITEGTKADSIAVQELFCQSACVGLLDPTYPAYSDGCLLSGKTHRFPLPCTPYFPEPPEETLDLIYLCSPNNPTGIAMHRELMTRWVAYAQRHNSIIFFDGAYAAFATPSIPKSIYEIQGARQVAIEMRSFSKTAGFTGLRCAYVIVPKELLEGKVHALWTLRQNIKCNGVSYPIQCGALASLSQEGKKEAGAQVNYYMTQTKALREGLQERGIPIFGGIDCPYLWWSAPQGVSSWQFFDLLLDHGIVSIPGIGFGLQGEGYVRLSGFVSPETVQAALDALPLLIY